MEFPSKYNLKWERVDDGFYNEDIFICCHAKNAMEEKGFKWAPFELAITFGREHPLPENKGVEPFIFHKWWGENENYPQYKRKKKRLKMAIRPLLFWRRSKKWKEEHGIQ